MNGFYKPEYASYIEGMGVGLMLARYIIENHRGKIKIKSKENIGTTVTVSLPTIKSDERTKN
jgi:K+-sensing histidine kinase KdpD